ncbi:MAG: hypothetical protein C5B54_05075 [Acidobacteria bacterium]|nr:MAG: hypothetical protein C5B54_05075 [Acidobacteriota bacterium]
MPVKLPVLFRCATDGSERLHGANVGEPLPAPICRQCEAVMQPQLPTVDPHAADQPWNNSTILTISAG